MRSPHDRPTDELRERAQQYALGTLPQGEREEFARHLFAGCPTCEAMVRTDAAVVGERTLEAPEAAPDASLKKRLAARLREEARDGDRRPAVEKAPAVQAWKEWSAAPAVDRFLPRDDAGFEPTGSKGVTVRRLFVDPDRRFATMLIRMAPGSSHPAHRHAGLEECYVLEGDLRLGDRVMHAGDYEVVSTGTTHARQWTEQGCLLLIRSSLADELV